MGFLKVTSLYFGSLIIPVFISSILAMFVFPLVSVFSMPFFRRSIIRNGELAIEKHSKLVSIVVGILIGICVGILTMKVLKLVTEWYGLEQDALNFIVYGILMALGLFMSSKGMPVESKLTGRVTAIFALFYWIYYISANS